MLPYLVIIWICWCQRYPQYWILLFVSRCQVCCLLKQIGIYLRVKVNKGSPVTAFDVLLLQSEVYCMITIVDADEYRVWCRTNFYNCTSVWICLSRWCQCSWYPTWCGRCSKKLVQNIVTHWKTDIHVHQSFHHTCTCWRAQFLGGQLWRSLFLKERFLLNYCPLIVPHTLTQEHTGRCWRNWSVLFSSCHLGLSMHMYSGKSQVYCYEGLDWVPTQERTPLLISRSTTLVSFLHDIHGSILKYCVQYGCDARPSSQMHLSGAEGMDLFVQPSCTAPHVTIVINLIFSSRASRGILAAKLHIWLG